MSADPQPPRATGPHAVVPIGEAADTRAGRSTTSGMAPTRRRGPPGSTGGASDRSTTAGRRVGAGAGTRRTGPVQTLPAPRRDRQPTILGMVVGPLLATAGVVALAAAHSAVGSPLGPKWGADLWEMVRSVLGLWVIYGPFTLYVQRHNAQRAIDDGGGSDGGPEGRHSPRALPGEEGEDDDGDNAGRPRRTARYRP